MELIECETDLFGDPVPVAEAKKSDTINTYDPMDHMPITKSDWVKISPFLAARMLAGTDAIFTAHRRRKMGEALFTFESVRLLKQEIAEQTAAAIDDGDDSFVFELNPEAKKFLRQYGNKTLSELEVMFKSKDDSSDMDSIDPDLLGFKEIPEFAHGFDLLDSLCWVFDLYGEPSTLPFIDVCNEAGRDWQLYQERIASSLKSELTDLVSFVLKVRGKDSARRVVMKLGEVIDLYHLLPKEDSIH